MNEIEAIKYFERRLKGDQLFYGERQAIHLALAALRKKLARREEKATGEQQIFDHYVETVASKYENRMFQRNGPLLTLEELKDILNNLQDEQSKGCEWCCDEILLDGEDMELELQHPLEDAPRMVYPNFCPMCGRPLKGAVDGTAQA